MNCIPGPTCARCGRSGGRPNVRRQCRPGLGDLVATGLAAVGITATRADTAARRLGFGGCGCAGRRAWLNQLSGKPAPAPENRR